MVKRVTTFIVKTLEKMISHVHDTFACKIRGHPFNNIVVILSADCFLFYVNVVFTLFKHF